MTVTTDLLAAFVRVAEHASVSAAAQSLGIGKSLVSKRVAQLEAAVGMLLFTRSTRKVALTAAGEAYLEYARRALEALQAGDEQVRALRAELTGTIRLAASVAWGQRVLARVLPEFLRVHPGLHVELRLDDRRVDLAFERIDLALRWTPHAPAGLACEPVARVGWLLVASPRLLTARGTPLSPDDLPHHDCLGYWSEAADDRWVLHPVASPGSPQEPGVTVQVRGRLHADNPDVVREAALAGLGIALLPDFLCEEALQQGTLVRVLPGWQPETRFGTVVSAIAPPERMRLARNRALLAFLREALA